MPKTKSENKDAEETVLAALLKETTKVDRAMVAISYKYFSSGLYPLLFKLITNIYTKHGSLITIELVSNKLSDWGVDQARRIKILSRIEELKTRPVNNAEFAYALKAVVQAYLSRTMGNILTSVTTILENSGGEKAFNALDKKIYDLKLNTIESSNIEVVDTGKVEEFIEYLTDVREHPERYIGIPSGWKILDDLTNGFHKSEYILVAAKSGSGKSMTLINWANHASKTGHNVVYVSLEMPQKVIRLRQLSLESEIPFLNLKSQNLTAEQLNKQEYVLRNEIANRDGKLFVVDVPKCSVGLIEAQLRQLQQNMNIDIVFVDYMGLLKPESHVKSRNGWEIAKEISNDLRELARTLRIPVVSAIQVNASGMEKTTEDDLELEDIAISKRISDPADLVIGVIWDKATNPHRMKLSVPKYRSGYITSNHLWCDLNICKITDVPIVIKPKEEDIAKVAEEINKEVGDLE